MTKVGPSGNLPLFVPFRRVTYGCVAALLASFLIFFLFFSAGGDGKPNIAAAYYPSNLFSWFTPAPPNNGPARFDPTKKKGVGGSANRSSGHGQSEETHGVVETRRLQRSCDIFSGRWIRDDRKPFYDPGSCPIVDPTFSCLENGRPDQEFLNWRWQPNDCDIPRYGPIPKHGSIRDLILFPTLFFSFVWMRAD